MPDVHDWICDERKQYADSKWPAENEDAVTRETIGANRPHDDPLHWRFWLEQYLSRSLLLGWDTPNGRQALGKYATTVVQMLESVRRVCGELPAPGHPSGEIKQWALPQVGTHAICNDAPIMRVMRHTQLDICSNCFQIMALP